MRKRIWITCAALLVICAFLLFRKAVEAPNPVLSQQGEALTNQQPPSRAAQPQAGKPAPNANVSKLPPALLAEMAGHGTPEASNALQQRALALWQAPIDFYGKVVDENTNPVAGVNIHFRWIETPTEDGARAADTQSDSEGLFSLRRRRGASLTVWFSKEGYYGSHGGQKGFNYALGPDIISPDPQNPVIFNLRKKGAPASLVALKRNYHIARDGMPLSIDLATGATTTGETGNLVVRCWTEDQGKRSGQRYNWRCRLTIPGGGIVTTDEEFAFLAPENGYTPSMEIAMPADRPGWKDDVDLKFFYRLADGRYGRMTLSMVAGGQHFCMIDSVMNTTGSRNLEPAN